jgi:hypothetical protein
LLAGIYDQRRYKADGTHWNEGDGLQGTYIKEELVGFDPSRLIDLRSGPVNCHGLHHQIKSFSWLLLAATRNAG